MSATSVPRETARQVLDLPMPDGNDAEAATIRDYLIALLHTLWREQDQFSGKKPFGNSGWEWDMFPPLINAGLVSGRLDEHGYIDQVDERTANELIEGAIGELGRTD